MIKRGESLVEVVVACGVIMLVFSGVLTMLMQSVNLNVSSRLRTQAIITAQLRMSSFVVSGSDPVPASDPNFHNSLLDSSSCLVGHISSGVVPVNDTSSLKDNNCKIASQIDDGSEVRAAMADNPYSKENCSYVVINDLASTEKSDIKTSGQSVDDAISGVSSEYKKVEVHVRWYSNGLGQQEYILTRLLRTQK